MPFNRWQVIDERTCRALFEDIIQKVLSQGGQPRGGKLDSALRQYIFRFTPEYEYWWPVYEPDPSKREVKWPVKIAKLKYETGDYAIYFKLGRPDDEFRYILVGLPQKRGDLIYPIIKESYKWTAERSEMQKTVSYGFLVEKENDTVTIDEKNFYKGDDSSVEYKVLLKFQKGNPVPVVDNTYDEPAVDLSGLDLILSPEKLERYYKNWEPFDTYAYQTFRSIIDLCKLQLNLTGNGQELEKVLRRDFLEFLYYDRDTVSSKELEKYENMSKEELIAELQDIRENAPGFERNIRTAYAIYAIRRKLSQDNSDRQFATEVEKWLTYIRDDSRKKEDFAIDKDVNLMLGQTLGDVARESVTSDEILKIQYEWGYEGVTYYRLMNCTSCPRFNIVSVRRLESLDPDKVVYKFVIDVVGGPEMIIVNVGFSRKLGQRLGLPWGVVGITCIIPEEMDYRNEDGTVEHGVGERERNFEFVYTRDFLEGRDPTDISAIYEELLSDPRGYTLTPYEDQLVLFFDYGIPTPFKILK